MKLMLEMVLRLVFYYLKLLEDLQIFTMTFSTISKFFFFPTVFDSREKIKNATH